MSFFWKFFFMQEFANSYNSSHENCNTPTQEFANSCIHPQKIFFKYFIKSSQTFVIIATLAIIHIHVLLISWNVNSWWKNIPTKTFLPRPTKSFTKKDMIHELFFHTVTWPTEKFANFSPQKSFSPLQKKLLQKDICFHEKIFSPPMQEFVNSCKSWHFWKNFSKKHHV